MGALASSALLLSACVQPPGELSEAQAEGKQAEPDAAPAVDPATKRKATIAADGWNEDIAWRGLEEGLQESKSSGMPMMMVVHTSWCGNCTKLKGTFNADDKLASLSEQFVMVHVDQDQHPEAKLYGPDGDYIPRVMFLDTEGNIDQGLQNPNRPSKYRYFYTPQEDLVATMRRALDQHGNKS